MKRYILNFSKWLFGLLGISMTGCSINSCETIKCEYGVPHAEFEVKGKVIDADTRNAVTGVSVTLHEVRYNNGKNTPEKYPMDSTVVNTNGEFTLYGNGFPNDVMFVKVRDLDTQSDGNYPEKVVEISLQNTEQGTGSWDNGTYSSDVLIELKEISQQE
ncbi:MAG: radical SAM-associated putative lipoprotein [Bacteroidales bacterium]|nr:radical SAM-associated putative lipoprotein [Bacteroidales bacterium]